MALTLSGNGVEVCAGNQMTPLPPNAIARHASPLPTDKHRTEFGEKAPIVDVKIRNLASAWTGAAAKKPINFAIVRAEGMRCSPNPLGLLSAWTNCLAPRGSLMVCIPSRARRAFGGRPITPLEHLYSDLKRRRTTACDEHRLASAFEDNPSQFPNPESVGVALAYLWALRRYDLDDHARRLLGPANERFFAGLSADPSQKITHHVFSVRSILAAIDILNSEASFLLAPYDVDLARTADDEDVLLFRRFEKPSLKSRQGQAMLAECTSMFQRQASASLEARNAVSAT